jgi:hypothetical protein
LNRISWKINLATPVEFIALILNEKFSDMSELCEMVNDWINFALFEYGLYKKYDQMTLTFASILISLKYKQMNTSEVEKIMNVSDLCEKRVIEDCMKEMLEIMFKDEEDSEENKMDIEIENSNNGIGNVNNNEPAPILNLDLPLEENEECLISEDTVCSLNALESCQEYLFDFRHTTSASFSTVDTNISHVQLLDETEFLGRKISDSRNDLIRIKMKENADPNTKHKCLKIKAVVKKKHAKSKCKYEKSLIKNKKQQEKK